MSVILITVVQTIVVSITDVDPGYAVAIVAGEEIPEAGSSLGFAVIWGLISTITTVIIPVAVPGCSRHSSTSAHALPSARSL